MIAVIAGASGLTGSKLLELMLADAQVTRVISVGRRPLGVKSAKLSEVLVKDLNELTSVADSLIGDVYFCCLGTTIKTAGSKEAFRAVDFQGVVDFAKVAEKNSARAFVLVSAAGANADSKIFYNRVKGETEKAMEHMKLGKLIIARPGLLIGERKEHRSGEAIAIAVTRGLQKILPTKLIARAATDVSQMMAVLLEAGLRAAGEPVENRNENKSSRLKILEAKDLN